MSSTKCIVSVCQFTATNNKDNNFEIVKTLVQESVDKNAKMVFLPEACDFIGKNKNELRKLAEPIDGPLMSSYKELAKTNNIWLSIGGFHERYDENTIYNSHIVINDEDKNINLRESDNNASGSQIVSPIKAPVGLLGLQILDADVLAFPSAFTSGTGKAHWEVLLRARAIENQCYVIAAAQYGCHNEKRTSYGHSMIVDPWGQILAECPKYIEGTNTDQSIAVATVDLDIIKKVRIEMPVFSHRRNDIYNLNLIRTAEPIDDSKNYPFSDKIVPGKTVFYASKYCYAFTNIRCVVPGHVLVSTLRVAKRLKDLSEEEIADLFATAIKVCKTIETVHDAQSTTLCVQDGPFAGQTVPHVHVHILPRKKGDFANNDDVYLHLAKHDSKNNTDAFRPIEDQIQEASNLRKYFY
ncbi:hypothetical protein GWI33_017510 [Rhynchophorus ferrugineus]|uniref:bis(5'-adenosyl)-triphosphatase n=1 Tax=Rhynchophorus ferrugineus TaxID=354439 RepID=A0A834M927_RHYFE|nr:hypothetical protein GWI33_017510 [Rhynchophorus ferrugineus]